MKCGIEIHQRLATEKLFCRCPSALSDSEPFKEIKRRLHVVESEIGEIDKSAKEQQERNRDSYLPIAHQSAGNTKNDVEAKKKLYKRHELYLSTASSSF